ncbi:MAG: NAD(P)H-hydrate dehydratase [Tannerellaceae bacterium]
MKIFATETIRDLDNYTIQQEGISSIDLMERAATAFTYEFSRRFPKHTRVVVFAGQGNNGGDALAIARLLLEAGFRVETYLFNPTETLSQDCQINKQRLIKMDRVEFTEVIFDFAPPTLGPDDVVIDGIFGNGINKPLSGGYAGLVNYLNQTGAYIVAIDVPSGLFCEDNRENDTHAVIRANLTLTFQFPKVAFFFAENQRFVGDWKILDIGLSRDGIERAEEIGNYIEEADVARLLQPRNKFSHKGTYGHAMLIAGSRGKMGAALLSAKATLRSGAGLLTAHIPSRGESFFQTAFPECMLSLDNNDECVAMTPDLSNISAIGLGPGLGQKLFTSRVVETVIKNAKVPLVLDADALNLIAADRDFIDAVPKGSILTPHPIEFDRLAGDSDTSIERLYKAVEFAQKHQLIVVLKGANTAICSPDGIVNFNSTGNQGMATAGSGDVLTGVILGLLAQGYPPLQAATIGVYIHGLAGDIAARTLSEESMIAGDIIDHLGKAFKIVQA